MKNAEVGGPQVEAKIHKQLKLKFRLPGCEWSGRTSGSTVGHMAAFQMDTTRGGPPEYNEAWSLIVNHDNVKETIAAFRAVADELERCAKALE